MKTNIEFYSDFETGEVFDFSRVMEKIESIPDGKLKEKLISDFSRCERTLMRMLRNTSQRLMLQYKSEGKDTYDETLYILSVGPDDYSRQGSLSFRFCFFLEVLAGYKREGTKTRDFNGGLIFHGGHKVFNEDLSVKSDIDFNDDSLASFSIHT